MNLTDFPTVAALPIAEKKALVEQLQSEIDVAEGPQPLTAAEYAELNRRTAALDADTSAGLSWEQVKADMAAARRGAGGA